MALVEHLVGSVEIPSSVLAEIAIADFVHLAMVAGGAGLPAEAGKLRQTLRLGYLGFLGLSVALTGAEVNGVLMLASEADASVQIDDTTTSAVVTVEDTGRLGA